MGRHWDLRFHAKLSTIHPLVPFRRRCWKMYGSSTASSLHRPATPPTPQPRTIPSYHENGKRSRRRLQARHPHRHRLHLRTGFDLRCQGWLTSRHLRSTGRSQRPGDERGDTLPDPLAAKEHHLRRADKAEEHLDHDGQQGSADGQSDPQGAASAGSEDAAEDLPSQSPPPLHSTSSIHPPPQPSPPPSPHRTTN